MTEEFIFAKLQEIDRTLKLSYAEAGIMALKVKTGELWRTRLNPETNELCTSWNQWLCVAMPYSNATIFAAVADVEELSDVPDADLAEIPAANIHIVKQLSTAVRADPRVLQAAKTLLSKKFVEQVQCDHPHQHLEARKILRFVGVVESAAEEIERALTMAECRGARTRNEQLEAIAVEAIQAWDYEDAVKALPVTLEDMDVEGVQ